MSHPYSYFIRAILSTIGNSRVVMEKQQKKIGAKTLQFWWFGVSSSKGDPKPKEGSILRRHYHWVSLGATAGIFFVIAGVWIIAQPLGRRMQLGSEYISGRTSRASIEQVIARQVKRYSISVVDGDQKARQFTLSEAGISLDVQKSAQSVISYNDSLSRRLLWWKTGKPSLAADIQEQKYQEFLQSHAHIVVKPLVNASLSVQSDGTITTTNSQPGLERSSSSTDETIKSQVTNLEPITITLVQRTILPVITDKIVAKTKTSLEEILSRTISFKAEDQTISASRNDIASWLTIAPNLTKKTYDISVDQTKVSDYVDKIAASTTRRPRDQVVVTSPDGTRSVLVQGINGRDVSNKTAISDALNKELKKTGAIALTLDFTFASFKTVEATSGPKFIEVNLTTKRMDVYENSVLLRTFLISAGAPAIPTVTGQYAIYSKVRIQDMKGFNADGSTYFTPNVEYVNYFYRDYAIHGNYWRPVSYFGAVNASHGCVGILNSDAEWIYNWAPIGTQVLVHT